MIKKAKPYEVYDSDTGYIKVYDENDIIAERKSIANILLKIEKYAVKLCVRNDLKKIAKELKQ